MTHPYEPVSPAVALTIAGSDSGGGAGIQADLKTMTAHGVFGTSVVTATTAQNTRGVADVHALPADHVAAQYDAVTEDVDVGAVKTGMLATAETVETVTELLAPFPGPVVVDPVMVAATGDRLLSPAAEEAYGPLIEAATLVTPNADEAAVLTDIEPTDEESARAAAGAILAMGADAALIKGGHIPGSTVMDVFHTDAGSETMRHPRIDTDATHGSGCTLSAAIATRLARGEALSDAVERGVAFMETAVRYHHAAGEGPGAVHHLVDIRNEASRNAAIDTAYEAADRLAELDEPTARTGAVVAATEYAESPVDVAGLADASPSGRARFGRPPGPARALLDARDARPDLRVGIECPFATVDAFADAGCAVLGDGDGATGSVPVVAPLSDPDLSADTQSALLCSTTIDAALDTLDAVSRDDDG